MARWFSKALLALVLTLCANLQSLAAVDSATAEALMRDCGMWEQLGSVQRGIRRSFLAAGARDGMGAMTAQQRNAILAGIDAAYDAERLRAAALAVFERDLNPEQVGPLTTWFRSPLGRFFTQLEESASASTADAAFKKGMAAFSGATPERQQVLQQLATETQAAEAMTSMVMQTTIGVQRGVLRALPDRPGPDLSEIRAEIEKQRQAMQKAFAPFVVAQYASTYAPATDAQLQDYLAFAGTVAGRSFTALGIAAVEQAMLGAAESMGQELVNARPGAST